jgi:GR25 family glycosyltransferase involved in LPS biosynthesis
MIKYVDKILIINHPDHKDRRKYQEDQAKIYDLNYQFVSAVPVDSSNGFQNKSLKSCFLSHIKALKIAHDTQELCLILEDDARLVDISEINLYLNSLLNDYLQYNVWDMIYFYPSMHDSNFSVDINQYSTRDTKVTNLHAYLVNPRKIFYLIEALEYHFSRIDNDTNNDYTKDVKRSHIDHVIANYIHPKMRVFCPKTNLIFQWRKEFGSTLGWGCRVEDKTYPFIVEN